MEFVSDESQAEGGFQATYEQMDGTPCGESLFKPSGKKQFQSVLDVNLSTVGTTLKDDFKIKPMCYAT